MKLPFDTADPVEYLTFGRQPWLLIRVWLLQVVILFFEVQILREVHPAVERGLDPTGIIELYVSITVLAMLVLVSFARRMGRLTFAPLFRHPVHIGLSVLGYLGLASVLVLPTVSLVRVPPRISDGVSGMDAALVVLVTSTLAALLIVEFYALFDLEDYPTRREIETTTRDWLRSLHWYEEPDGPRTRREAYERFRERTDELLELLDYANTSEGRRLAREFERWVDDYRRQSLLSQEAIVRGDVQNERLQAQHETLRDLVERFERISES